MAKPREAGVGMEIKGLTAFLKVLNKLPKDLQAEIRDAATAIAGDLVSGAQRTATGSKLNTLVAAGLKVKRDRIPVVSAGTGRLSSGAKMNDVFWGAEFGGRSRPSTMQFQPHRGRQGYFLYPTARSQSRAAMERWLKAVDNAFEQWDHTST